jgi:Na+/proline symporter
VSENPPSAPPPLADRLEQARIAYVQSRTYTVLALIFLACGVFVFVMVYNRYVADNLWAALKDLSTMGMILMAFLPALILTFFARRAEKRYLELLKPE